MQQSMHAQCTPNAMPCLWHSTVPYYAPDLMRLSTAEDMSSYLNTSLSSGSTLYVKYTAAWVAGNHLLVYKNHDGIPAACAASEAPCSSAYQAKQCVPAVTTACRWQPAKQSGVQFFQ
jgi:hypothetical protein